MAPLPPDVLQSLGLIAPIDPALDPTMAPGALEPATIDQLPMPAPGQVAPAPAPIPEPAPAPAPPPVQVVVEQAPAPGANTVQTPEREPESIPAQPVEPVTPSVTPQAPVSPKTLDEIARLTPDQQIELLTPMAATNAVAAGMLRAARTAKMDADDLAVYEAAQVKSGQAIDEALKRREDERVRRKEAADSARADIARRQAEIDDLSKRGPKIDTGKLVVLAIADALAGWLSKGKLKGQGIETAMNAAAKKLADQLQASREGKQLAQQGAAVAAQELADVDVDYQVALADVQRQLGQDLAEVAARSQTRAGRERAQLASQQYLDAARQTLLGATQQAEDRAWTLRERELDAAEREARIGKTEAETEKLDRQGRGGNKGPGSPMTVDPEIANLPDKDRARVEALGVRDPYTGRFLKTKNGQYWIAPSAKAAEAVQNIIPATGELLRVGTEMARLMDELTFLDSSSTLAREKWQQVTQYEASLTELFKNAKDMGALDNGLLEFSSKYFTAGLDPAGLRDATPALIQALYGQAKFANAKLGQSATGPARINWVLPGQKPASEKTAEAQAQRQVTGTGQDHTGKPSEYDPKGEAASKRNFAADIDQTVDASTNSVNQFLALKSPPGRVNHRTGMTTPTDLGMPFAEAQSIVRQAQSGVAKPETVKKAEQILRKAGLYDRRQPLLLGRDATAQKSIANRQRREASAIEVTQRLLQNNQPLTSFNLDRAIASGQVTGVETQEERNDFLRALQKQYDTAFEQRKKK